MRATDIGETTLLDMRPARRRRRQAKRLEEESQVNAQAEERRRATGFKPSKKCW